MGGHRRPCSIVVLKRGKCFEVLKVGSGPSLLKIIVQGSEFHLLGFWVRSHLSFSNKGECVFATQFSQPANGL